MLASPTTAVTLADKVLQMICPLANNSNYGELKQLAKMDTLVMDQN